MRIRKSKIEDAAEIASLHKGTIRFINKGDYSPEQISAWSKRTSAKRFRESHHLAIRYVALDGEKIIGYSDFKKDKPEKFWGLYVHKNHLGKGVGSRLLLKMEEVAKSMGADRLELEATKTAKTFYEKHGFKVIKKSKHPIDDQELDVFVMEKKL